jgi:hypothetical protein
MYKPKRYVRLDQLYAMPTVADCKRLLGEATKARGSTVELPWRSQKTYIGYSLTVRVELGGGEPLWTLYEGEGNRSRVVWSSPFEDIELMNDVLHLSLPGEEGQATPAANSPAPAIEEEPREQAPVQPTFDEATGMRRPSEGPDFYQGMQDFERAKEPDPERDRDRESSRKAPAYPTPTITPVTPPSGERTPATPTPPPTPPAPTPGPAYPYPPQQQQQQGYPGYPPGYPPPQGYPGYPPGYPPPQGYPGYPPGYPVDPRYYQQQPPYAPPYGQPPAPQPAATVPVQPGAVPSTAAGATSAAQSVAQQSQSTTTAKAVDPDLMRKRPNILLGNFLIEAGLIPETTLQAALQLQDMVKNGSLKTTQAAEAVRRAHSRGGAIDQSFFTATPNVVVDPKDTRGVSPPLGQILVEAGLIHPGALRAALNLQEVVRTGAMTKEDALSSFIKEHFGANEKPEAKKEREAEQAIDLLKQAGLLNEKDVTASRAVKKRHGGNISKILAAAGKLDSKTFDAAITCKELMKGDRLRVEQAMIVLNYCQRSRMTFDEAIDELGWEKP